jgi:hypothetical protein
MSNFAPYLIQRGNTLFFRISVPEDLRLHIGLREITKTLRTPNKQKTTPIALSLVAQAKQLFNKFGETWRQATKWDKAAALVEHINSISLREFL